MCTERDPRSLFTTAGAAGGEVLAFGRAGSEVKSNTNKVETLIVAFMDGGGTSPSEGRQRRVMFKEEMRKSRIQEEKMKKLHLFFKIYAQKPKIHTYQINSLI
ncbi:hypothetical protein AMECASPLE_004438 [Ameca splendens]|uniref:Uncharacterized protein n=1 Tax=Ameca splendens TaxID=208324 RepID=A0ABV0XBU9_9TELE